MGVVRPACLVASNQFEAGGASLAIAFLNAASFNPFKASLLRFNLGRRPGLNFPTPPGPGMGRPASNLRAPVSGRAVPGMAGPILGSGVGPTRLPERPKLG